ncbi:glycosyltransferase family 2 protein [Rossellomorea vietnamensis]|uniref:glycosyltransferase family 2 protein n=1 Tax=Rossellomorea vietnamensis TaxID=218284 RepID=UPI001E507209|nr:glycosyltransferase [Rossellomorea vietnamensis]MCC5802343.1 glycosyltransferase [Rossellomorea vietnamensis]
MKPTVSIVIPFYNCAYVDQAIRSALNQTYPNTEVIVVDDGSTKELERLVPFLNRITYIKKENGGTATAVNEGIKRSSGEYIAWLSSDDHFHKQKVEKQLNYMLNKGAKASFHNYDYINKNNETLLPFVGKRFSNAEEIYRSIIRINPINGCSVMVHRDVYKEIGYFSPHLKFTQDYEMWCRMLMKGYVIYYLDEVLLKYRSHPDSGTSKNPDKMKREVSAIRHHYHHQIHQYAAKHYDELRSIKF